ncbi:MAG: hypothetical protein QNJ45_08390 [Ardenticatenaceae bacterium]|nr:hypothetical protein [Ardenticatenaceae bacterium]
MFEVENEEKIEQTLDQFLSEQPIHPLPNRFSQQILNRLPTARTTYEIPHFHIKDLFSWSDAALALLITFLLTGLMVSGGQILGWLVEAMASFIPSETLPLIVLVLILQAAILGFILWWLLGDEGGPSYRLEV